MNERVWVSTKYGPILAEIEDTYGETIICDYGLEADVSINDKLDAKIIEAAVERATAALRAQSERDAAVRVAAQRVCENASNDDDWECVPASDLDALRALLSAPPSESSR